MNEPRESHSPIVPMKSPNKAGQPAAEEVEGRGLAKGNLPSKTHLRTQRRPGVHNALVRVRWAGSTPPWRYDPRQEPDAVIPPVRIRGGGHGQP